MQSLAIEVFSLVVTVTLLGIVLRVAVGSWPPAVQRLVMVAFGARVLGSTIRLWTITDFYGRGDALMYYDEGRLIANALWAGDTAPFFDMPQAWGTPFVVRVSALVVAVSGGGLRAVSFVFSFLSLVGLLLIAKAFVSAFPRSQAQRVFLMGILLWPSLVFWPSSVGKEALIILAVGLVVHGYGVRTLRILPLAGGLLLAAGVRPHIAAMLAVALGVADWIQPGQSWTPARLGRAFVLVLVAVVTTRNALEQFGVGDAAGLQTFVDFRSGQTAQGGSRIDAVGGPATIPMAFVNVLMRPFIWEVSNPLMLLSAVEVLGLWGLAWRFRGALRSRLDDWRRNRHIAFAMPALVVLIVFYGGYISNLGILARQRVIVLPLLFFVAAGSVAVGELAQRRRRPGLTSKSGRRSVSMNCTQMNPL